MYVHIHVYAGARGGEESEEFLSWSLRKLGDASLMWMLGPNLSSVRVASVLDHQGLSQAPKINILTPLYESMETNFPQS